MSLIECLVDGEGPDPHENHVRVELHGNDEACDSARKGPDGPWEWYLPASLTGVVKVRGLHLFCNRSPPAYSQRSSSTPVVQQEGSSPTQPWKGGGGSSSPRLRKLEIAAYPAALPVHLRTVSSRSPALIDAPRRGRLTDAQTGSTDFSSLSLTDIGPWPKVVVPPSHPI